MKTLPKSKTLALVRYRELILDLHDSGVSGAAIAKQINHRLIRLKNPTSVSAQTIRNWIKKYAS